MLETLEVEAPLLQTGDGIKDIGTVIGVARMAGGVAVDVLAFAPTQHPIQMKFTEEMDSETGRYAWPMVEVTRMVERG